MNCLPEISDDLETLDDFRDNYVGLIELMLKPQTSYDDKSFVIMLMSKVAEWFEEMNRAFILSSNFL